MLIIICIVLYKSEMNWLKLKLINFVSSELIVDDKAVDQID